MHKAKGPKLPRQPYGGYNETNQLWRDHAEHLKRIRQRRRDKFTRELDEAGFEYHALTPYQYRFNLPNGILIDIYPTNRKYHNITTGVRGRLSAHLWTFLMRLL